MKKFFKKFKFSRQLVISFILVVLASFAIAASAHAADGVSGFVTNIIGYITAFFVGLLGKVLTLIMDVMITVAQYNGFVNEPIVVQGWVVVRDLCNMFFILLLLIIAFGVILRLPSYTIGKMVPELILAAVLVNFSRLICGLLIDFSQVIMLSFVNAFREIGAPSLISQLGLTQMLNWNKTTLVDNFSTLIGYVLALVYLIIVIAVVLIVLLTLLMRIIFLWMYIILSPLPFFLKVVPTGKKYADQWFGEFSKLLIEGPLLAFFIWAIVFSSSCLSV